MIHIAAAGMRNHSIEVWEARRPVVIERLEFVPDSAGAGTFRGGLAIEQHYRALLDCYVTFTIERTTTPGWGAAGGRPGVPNRARVRYPDGSITVCDKATGVHVPAGSVVEVFMGSGGGYGPPNNRPRSAILNDIQEGYSTADGAASTYGQFEAV